MSQSHPVEVSLAEVVRRSSDIVVVQPGSPFVKDELVEVKEGGKQYPPYKRQLHRYRVLEPMRGDLKASSIIEVVSAHDRQNEYAYRLEVTQNTSKSVYIPHYQPREPYDIKQPHILFLIKSNPAMRYTEVTGQSAEKLSMRNEIERLMLTAGAPLSEVNQVLPRLEPSTVVHKLVFEFNNVRLEKEGQNITLVIRPVWQDAQTDSPPGFEIKNRTLKLSASEFEKIWLKLGAIDFKHYANLGDTDFVNTPPDMQHVEQLRYQLNGVDVVQWGHSYRFLRKPLREPLMVVQLALQQLDK